MPSANPSNSETVPPSAGPVGPGPARSSRSTCISKLHTISGFAATEIVLVHSPAANQKAGTHMQLSSYLGKHLKSDFVIEVLEHFDMDVVYDFDRLHENTADSYSSSAESAGFEFRFDERQILSVIWCYIRPRSGFSAINTDVIGAPCFHNFSEAKSHAMSAGIKTSQSKGDSAWIRFEHDGLWIHYEYSDDKLALVTLTLP